MGTGKRTDGYVPITHACLSRMVVMGAFPLSMARYVTPRLPLDYPIRRACPYSYKSTCLVAPGNAHGHFDSNGPRGIVPTVPMTPGIPRATFPQHYSRPTSWSINKYCS